MAFIRVLSTASETNGESVSFPVSSPISGRNHLVFRYVPEGSEHPTSVSVSTTHPETLPMARVAVPYTKKIIIMIIRLIRKGLPFL